MAIHKCQRLAIHKYPLPAIHTCQPLVIRKYRLRAIHMCLLPAIRRCWRQVIHVSPKIRDWLLKIKIFVGSMWCKRNLKDLLCWVIYWIMIVIMIKYMMNLRNTCLHDLWWPYYWCMMMMMNLRNLYIHDIWCSSNHDDDEPMEYIYEYIIYDNHQMHVMMMNLWNIFT